jgi:hypothetical protein
MKKIITLCVMSFLMTATHAQKAQLLFYGVIEEAMLRANDCGPVPIDSRSKVKAIDNVNVNVYVAGELVSTSTSKENGFYGVLLRTGASYEVVFEKDGYFSKTFVMNCKNLKHPIDGSALKCPMDIDLYKEVDNKELQAMTKKPYGMCSVAQNQLKWDKEAMTVNRKKFLEIARPIYQQNEK